MEYIILGNSDLRVSRIGFGCAAIGGYDYGPVDDGESAAAVQRALDVGINFFDTADVYGLGHSERVLGSALGPRRHDVVIATKGGVGFDASGRTWRDASPGYISRAIDASLERLGVDCIPLYQVHWPDGRTPFADTMNALIRCREQGKIRHVGWCNVSCSDATQISATAPIVCLQVLLNVIENGAGADVERCWRTLNVAGLAHSSLAHGLLSGRYTSASVFSGSDLRRRTPLLRGEAAGRTLAAIDRVQSVAGAVGRTPAQVAVRWVLQQPGIACALAGMKRPAQVDENAGAIGWRLEAHEMSAVSERGVAERA